MYARYVTMYSYISFLFGKIIVLLVSTPVNVCQMGINYVKQVSSNERCALRWFLITTPFDVYVNPIRSGGALNPPPPPPFDFLLSRI